LIGAALGVQRSEGRELVEVEEGVSGECCARGFEEGLRKCEIANGYRE